MCIFMRVNKNGENGNLPIEYLLYITEILLVNNNISCFFVLSILFNYGGKCYCLTSLKVGSTRISNRECRYKCPGDLSQTCGGKGAISVMHHKFTDKGKPL